MMPEIKQIEKEFNITNIKELLKEGSHLRVKREGLYDEIIYDFFEKE